MNNKRTTTRQLAVYPSTFGFGFAVFEGPARMIDWGLRGARGDKNDVSLKRMEQLLARYKPDIVIVEDSEAKGTRRCRRVQTLAQELCTLAAKHKARVKRISRAAVVRAFTKIEARRKPQIARALADCLPELEPHLPPPRKPWMAEDPRMGIFDAVALALTYFHLPEKVTIRSTSS